MDESQAAAFQELMLDWSSAGRRLSATHTGRCAIHDCSSMPYVALSTATYRRAVCLKHFEHLRRLSVV